MTSYAFDDDIGVHNRRGVFLWWRFCWRWLQRRIQHNSNTTDNSDSATFVDVDNWCCERHRLSIDHRILHCYSLTSQTTLDRCVRFSDI